MKNPRARSKFQRRITNNKKSLAKGSFYLTPAFSLAEKDAKKKLGKKKRRNFSQPPLKRWLDPPPSPFEKGSGLPKLISGKRCLNNIVFGDVK